MTTFTVGGTGADVVFTGGTVVTTAIPEPASVVMLGTGVSLAICALLRLRRVLRLA